MVQSSFQTDIMTDLCYRGHGESERQAGSGVVFKVVLTIFDVTLILEGARAAVMSY